MNITLSNNADNLDFGLVGCRRSVPSLQRILGHLEDSLAGLEQAVGTGGGATRSRRKSASSPTRSTGG
jgi:diacylglycerol O-acyltransferase